jgi:hypothetical protein
MSAAALSGSVPILAFLVSVISAGLSYVVAGSKGHNPIAWLVVGFFLGPLGLIAAAGLADRKNHLLLSVIARASDQIGEELERIEEGPA